MLRICCGYYWTNTVYKIAFLEGPDSLSGTFVWQYKMSDMWHQCLVPGVVMEVRAWVKIAVTRRATAEWQTLAATNKAKLGQSQDEGTKGVSPPFIRCHQCHEEKCTMRCVLSNLSLFDQRLPSVFGSHYHCMMRHFISYRMLRVWWE